MTPKFVTFVTKSGEICVFQKDTGTCWATVPTAEQAAIIVSALNAYVS